MRLFHFSDDPSIRLFEPRAARTPAERPEWLNGPLVWAIDDWHAPMYLFPRECPRILLWPTPDTTDEDRAQWFGTDTYRMIAFTETAWQRRLRTEEIYRYEFPLELFEDIKDAGMWVAREPVKPLAVERLIDLPDQLRARNVDLRLLDRLTPLRTVWQSSLHASGIRLRNAQDWGKLG